MARKIEDVLAEAWPALTKLKLNDLQVYRAWQIIEGHLAEAGWLRKRPGKPHSRPRRLVAQDQWDELEDLKGLMRRHDIEPAEHKKKDHISTTELINEQAKKERGEDKDYPFLGPSRRSLIRTDDELDREAARKVKRKRDSQW